MSESPSDSFDPSRESMGSGELGIPELFHEFGAIAVPIPPREKGTTRPRTEDHLYAPTDPVIEAYLEAGHNYGLACRNDFAVVDADDPEALAPLIDALPETAWQVSGSGEGEHYFLRVPGLESDIPLDDPKTDENVGHIKAAPQSYVVGPGSVHPSGNRYGPLQGDTIATIAEDELREILEPFHQSNEQSRSAQSDAARSQPRDEHGSQPREGDEHNLSVYNVLSATSYSEETRVAHPFHGSDTGANFMVDADGETWRCWRHDCTGNALHLVGIEAGVITCGEWDPGGLDSDTWHEIFTTAREAGYDLSSGEPEPHYGGQYPIETCEPPAYDPQPFDAEAHWADLQGERYERAREADRPVIWADDAGSGKTTNAALAALDRGDPHAILFDKHEKAREFVTDDVLPEAVDYFHLRGAAQKRETVCMDADHADEPCPEHGETVTCPHMCPIFDLPAEDSRRQQFEAVMAEVGPTWAHVLLDPHDGDDCTYDIQFDILQTVDHVVGVHEYLPLATVTNDRQVIVDEKPRTLATEREFTVAQLTRGANDLVDRSGPVDAVQRTLEAFGKFAHRIVDVVTGAADAPAALTDLDPPAVVWDTYETYDSAAGHYREEVPPDEAWQYAEALARAKMRYNGAVLRRMQDDEWEGTPLCFDALLAAAIEAGLPREPVVQAIAAPLTLADCPRCRRPTDDEHGARVCSACGWDEREDTITQQGGERARASIELGTHDIALAYHELPLTSDLPAAPLVLDATATPERIGALFDTEPILEGDVSWESNLHVTQVLDGQYHYGTIRDAIDEDRALADRIQQAIDTAGDLHERPLFVLQANLIPEFEFPDHAEVLHYHAVRGLNRDDCDAVICIGAPHPRIGALEREAELLTQHRTDLRVGGDEHSTRHDAPNPPVYRKLYYEDDAGDGRAVPTKHYTGLVGALFREAREKELKQALHRIRPLLAAETKHAYLLTNVPTAVPVDIVATFEELTAPLEAFLPVPEGAVRLLEYVRDIETGEGPDGFRAEQLMEREGDEIVFNRREFHRLAVLCGEDVTYRTVCNWVNALVDAGLLEPGAYEPRAGVRFTADPGTLKSALSVLTRNTGFKVAAVRRFVTLADGSDGSLRWLKWARDVLRLTGEVVDFDPPPASSS